MLHHSTPWCWGASLSAGNFRLVARAAAIAALFPCAALAYAPEQAKPASAPSGPEQLELSKDIVVHNWILCATQEAAETLVSAADTSARAAADAMARLQSERSCGRFPKMRVILEMPLVESSPFAEHRIKAYGAQINLGGTWVPAFVIYARQPEE
jgi:hypothetical protein